MPVKAKLSFERDPILHRLRKLFQLQIISNVSLVSDKSWEVAQGSEEYFPEAIYLKKHLNYALKTISGETVQGEVERISGRKVFHKPTVLYQIDEAKVLSGILYKNAFRLRLNEKRESIFNIFGFRTVESEGLLVSSWNSNKYFGHWLFDECPRVLAGNKLGIETYRAGRAKYGHQQGYEDVFNISNKDVRRSLFNKLFILSDASLNGYRQERYQVLRGKILSGGDQKNKLIYIKRGKLGAKGRELINEAELIEKLVKNGFFIVDQEKMSVAEIIDASRNADIIMGVEGSALVHGFFNVKDVGTLISIVPESRFTNPIMEHCSSIGIKYAFLVGRSAEGGFNVDLNDLDEILMLVEK